MSEIEALTQEFERVSVLETLKKELATARKEIQNLRKQVSSLAYVQKKDIQNIRTTIENYQCESCKNTEHIKPVTDVPTDSENPLKPIGFISTVFSEKRGVPRQPSINRLLGRIEISQNVFNNPEHSLDGLSSFSHLWIIYQFHRNESHAKAKVKPPRLGSRVGVFSTRSPHRPCPIGLSLVEIDRIDDKFVYFYGTDMVDGTPVLDIKPYIPVYDYPGAMTNLDREDPDGEENFGATTNPLPSSSAVKVPNWIENPTKMRVKFTDRATEQLGELELHKKDIEEVVSQDPRSVYLRTKHGSQLFTFQIAAAMVSCQFDDETSTVTIVQLLKAEQFDTEVCKDLYV